MKKAWTLAGIFAAFGILIAMIAGFSGRAAAEEHQDHCICGGNSAAATAANGHTCAAVTWEPISTEAEFKAKMQSFDATTHTYLYLTADIEETSAFCPGKNQTLHLCLNGHTITAAENKRAFELCGPSGAGGFNAHMTVCDCSSAGTGEIKANVATTLMEYQGGNILITRELTFTLFGGTISGGRAKTAGGNIAADPYSGGSDARFYMYGGTVKDGMIPSSGTGGGGNVNIGSGCKFYMYGGTISGGRTESASGGGNVFLNDNAYFELHGGEIRDGSVKATGSGGGNVYMRGGADFRMTGGTLNHGCANNGGNLFINGTTKPVISGGVIKDGYSTDTSATSYGANINLVNASGLTIRNTTISGGTLPTTGKNTYGGNISIKNTSWLVLENVTMTGGTAMMGGNLSITGTTARAEMTGGSITGGTAVKNGSAGGFGGNVSLSGTTSFTMNSGTIADGFANGNSGGNIGAIESTTVTINGGMITGGNNASDDMGGIAVFYDVKNATLNLNGGTITGNHCGVYMAAGTLNVSGSPVLENNGKNADLRLSNSVSFSVSAPLTSGAKIPVGYPVGTFFADSEADYSFAFQSVYESSGAVISYDSAEKMHQVSMDGYVDLYRISPSEAATKKIDVYIISGQSNAAGSTGLSTAQSESNRDYNIYKNVHYWSKRVSVDGSIHGSTIMDYRPVTEGLGYDTSHIGPELGMARVLNPLYESSERQAIIFKYAAGGTSVTAHQLDDGTWYNNTTNTPLYGTWYPSSLETETSVARGENRITNFLVRGFKSTISEFYDELLSKGYLPENINFVSFNWLQGESDRSKADEYGELFLILLDEFRTYIAGMTGNAADASIPTVVNEIGSTFGGALQSNVTSNWKFITMQRELGNTIENYVTIPSSHFVLATLVNGTSVTGPNGDTSHYGYEDVVAVGEMLAEASLDPETFAHVHCDCGTNTAVGDHTTHTDKTWYSVGTEAELYAATAIASTDIKESYIYLVNDITIVNRITIGKNNHVHLCLNGHTIQHSGAYAPFVMNSNAEADHHDELVLTDCTDTPGFFKGGSAAAGNSFNGGAIYVGKGCGLILYRGNMVGRHVAYGDDAKNFQGSGGTVALGAGTPASYFTMYGGTISGGKAQKRGGNVFVENGTFTMYGGTISGNPGAGSELNVDGANVYVYGGSFIMNGGTIENGNSKKNGGNLYIGGGSVTMHGGTIQGGYADAAGGNVFVGEGRTFTMNGGSVLNGACNTSNGFNIQVNGSANLNGGTIQGANSRNNSARFAIAAGKSSTRINIDGATINNTIQCVAGSSVTTLNSGTVYGFSVYNGNLVINGGQVNSAPTISGTSGTNTMTVNGGYIKGKPARTGSKPGLIILKGGHYTVDPTEDYTADGYYVFETNELYNGLNYQYEVGKGHLVETTSRAATGYLGTVAAISGGGRVMEGKPFTLTAPAVSGYRLIGWYEGSTELGVENTYTSTCTEDREIAAVYEVGAAEGFRVSVSGTSDYTITGEAVGSLYKAGTEVTVKYTGTDTFKGFSNAMGKLVSRDAEYTFTLAGDTDLTAMLGSASSPLITFYTINSQVYRSGALDTFTELPAVPTVAGKKNGVWKAGGTEITDLAALASKAEGQTALDVTPAYEDDAASVYEVTVIGVLLGESGAPTTWTAYADGDASYGPVNVNATVKLEQPAAATKTFRYYANAAGDVLSTSAGTYVRFRENATVYAVYADAAGEAETPRVTFITAKRIDGTICFEALRDVPAGYTLKEQGILFNVDSMTTGTLEDALRYNNSAESYKYVSTGKNANDVTGLTLKNVSVTVNARAYVIYNDGTNEGIVYSEIATVN